MESPPVTKPFINRADTIYGVCYSALITVWICVCLRLYTRFHVIRSPGWDDFFLILSLGFTSVCLIGVCTSVKSGLGRSGHRFVADEMVDFMHSVYVYGAAYHTSTGLVKISLLLQYLRICQPATVLHTACRISLGLVALWSLAYSVMAWFPCMPVPVYWTAYYYGAAGMLYLDSHCYGIALDRGVLRACAFINMAFDVLVMALPLMMWKQTWMEKRTKRGLAGIVVMWICVNTCAIWRLCAVWSLFDSLDLLPAAAIAGGLEVTLACICASIPVFWGPMAEKTSAMLNQIFVTKEVTIDVSNRYEAFTDGDNSEDTEMFRVGEARPTVTSCSRAGKTGLGAEKRLPV
ncbi:hypothetical protein B0T17DRAFT_658465 [Bombardia bombarda]|uniref:Rhodopsin domain-containing protein n=1 Tax=Bombardia bombarda TaxID=252184 RepID=A0AA39TKM1_9PEZI|nr:hypothetical protein B0T17DRAFT_658465 [Bombardia bombarda]